MSCTHEGFHGIGTSYDRRHGVLVYFWVCERCGERLDEVKRETYRPAFDPYGHQRFLGSGGLEHTHVAANPLARPTLVGEQVDVPENL